MKTITRVLAFALLAAAFAAGEGTQRWAQTSFDDFEKGTVKGVAIRSDGVLELAPAFKAVATTPSAYIWAVAADAEGNVYAAAGSPGRVYRITPAGAVSIIFQPQELQVQALVADARGTLYAATSPDGKVYKIERKSAAKEPKKSDGKKNAAPETKPGGPFKPSVGLSGAVQSTEGEPSEASKTPVDDSFTSSVLFDPKTKYIWDLALDAQGQLYVATGDRGEIFRVDKSGAGSLFFKSDEAHIRVLAFDRTGNLIAGSDGSGLVYRISPAGEAFVLYSAPKKEITALAVDPQGNIYAAGVGEKRQQPPGTGPTPMPPPVQPASIMSVAGSIAVTSVAQMPPGGMAMPNLGPGAAAGSELYVIAPDGSPRRIWSPKEDMIYALAFNQRGQLVVGTGNRGHIYIVQPDGDFTDLVRASANQVIGFVPAAGKEAGLYCVTSNLGKVFLLSSTSEAEGSYDSDVFDAKIFSKWGRAEVRGTGHYEVYARSGNVDNPDRNWSPWRKLELEKGAPMDVPPARFVQWRAVLHAGSPAAALDSVGLNYLPKNVAPVIEEVAAQVGARFNPGVRMSPDNAPVQVGGQQTPQPRFEMPTSAVHDRDSIAVRWSAHDDNEDQLIYSVYYRGDGETQWKLLKDKLTDKFYSWDAGLLPDGGYTVKVVASDAPSHSPDEALTATKESARFEVDHTPPQVADLAAKVDGSEVHVTFRGVDSFSPIKRAEYSIDAGDWQFVEPVGQISDSKIENYDFAVPVPRPEAKPESNPHTRGGDGNEAPRPGEHVIVVRVYDRYDNMSAAKAIFTVK